MLTSLHLRFLSLNKTKKGKDTGIANLFLIQYILTARLYFNTVNSRTVSVLMPIVSAQNCLVLAKVPKLISYYFFLSFCSMWADDARDPGFGHVYRLCLGQCSTVPDRCHAHTTPLCPAKRWGITPYRMPTQSKSWWRAIHPRSTAACPSKWCHVDASWWAALAEVHRLLWQWLW